MMRTRTPGVVVVPPQTSSVGAGRDRPRKALARREYEGADVVLTPKTMKALFPQLAGHAGEHHVCVSEGTANALKNALQIVELRSNEQHRESRTRGVVSDIEAGSGKAEVAVDVGSNGWHQELRGTPGRST